VEVLILIAESKFEQGEYEIILQPRKLAVEILSTVVWFAYMKPLRNLLVQFI
jgi:hypothetical protein